MIGRRLKRDVQRDLQTVLPGDGHQMLEVIDRAELRMDRGVAALTPSDGQTTH